MRISDFRNSTVKNGDANEEKQDSVWMGNASPTSGDLVDDKSFARLRRHSCRSWF